MGQLEESNSTSDEVEVESGGSTSPEEQVIFDRGLTAWLQVLVGHLLVINGFGYISSFGLFQSHWVQSLERSSSDIAWVGSLQMFLLFFVGTFSGRAMDAGYFRSLIIAGSALQLIGTFATSVATAYWQLILAQGIIQGLGNGLLFTPLVALVSVYFLKRRTLALGLAACGAPVGGVIFPVVLRQLEGHLSFGWIVRIMGFVILFNTALVLVLARPRVTVKASRPLAEWAAFKEVPYVLFATGIFFTIWGIYIAYFYTATFGRNVIHVSSTTSYTFLMVLNGVGIPGRLIPALLADRYFGTFNTLLFFVAAAGILLFSWMAVEKLDGFTAFLVVYGFCANAVQTLFPSTLAGLTKDITKMGVRTGMVFTVGSIACLTSAPIAGRLIDIEDGSYRGAQAFGGTTVFLGVAFLLSARLAQRDG
ncbi:MFS monocarboxylate transporter-like protein [Venustampulla echinocandica]|uniref:MFS monocarboxylate transporter-like protein n=1 Tax=Venustampulla echinocandica TaxID=2656787 RepID=A0A370TG39_9HELO|nr:MFS monocarboxylate transporter-like protein [Venustampulla echinocandica]RDL33853.1 MFS monocarboxylate transporter-like protein [Venustampulla echinocandica]